MQRRIVDADPTLAANADLASADHVLRVVIGGGWGACRRSAA